MGVVFGHDEGLNHIYNQPGNRQPGKEYFAGIDGEFAIGFRDDPNGRIVLARDWIGAVPLHYMVTGDGGIVTSNTIGGLMDHQDYSYRNVRAVKSGHFVYIPVAGRFTEKDIHEERYNISLSDVPLVEGSPQELGQKIRDRLVAETKKRLDYASGRKVGLSFSGGIDSFSVALAIAELGKTGDVEAYCINTEGEGKDWPNAQRAARYLGLKLHEVQTTKSHTLEAIPDVIRRAELYKDYDIFCAAANYLLGEQLGERGIEATFTGDGANEAFRDYTSWGCFCVDKEKIVRPKMSVRMLEGRGRDDPMRSPQLGDGYSKSASRGSKILASFGIDAFNPFLARPVAEYVSRIDLSRLTEWDESGQPLWKQRIMQAAFPDVPEDLFSLKTRMQDGVGTTDVVRNIRSMDLIKYGGEDGYAKYGRGAMDSDFQVENPYYYTDLFRKYFEDMFVAERHVDKVREEWYSMLSDLELAEGGRGWGLATVSRRAGKTESCY